MTSKRHIRFYGLSEKGLRPNNEDAWLSLRVNDDTCIFAVADGMGGTKGGEVASNHAIAAIRDFIKTFEFSETFATGELKPLLTHLFELAQAEVRKLKEISPDLGEMGTTLTILLVHNDLYVWGSIGDSRIYVINDQGVHRITRDHNFMEDPAEQYDEKSLQHLPDYYKFALTRVIDGKNDIPDIFPAEQDCLTIENNTTWVICSDGLIIDKEANYDQVLETASSTISNIQGVAEWLADFALHNGSTDNITVVVVKASEEKVEEMSHENETPTQKFLLNITGNSKIRSGQRNLLIIAGIAVLLLCILLWLFWNMGFREPAPAPGENPISQTILLPCTLTINR